MARCRSHHILLLAISCVLCVSIGECLKIAAFNIQVFGRSKSSKPDVMDVLVKIISRYDIVLIQEIRDSSGEAIEKLLDQTNAQNVKHPFAMKISERLGRTTSKEQYAYFYRPSLGLEVIQEYIYHDGDESKGTDTFEREPYIVLFKSTDTVPIINRFAIAGIHVDPDKAVEEIKALSDVFDDIKAKMNVANIMIMGDFNAGCSYVAKKRWAEIPLKHDTAYSWLINDEEDTTVSRTDCAYDRFVVTGPGFSSAESGGLYPESAKVFKYDTEYGLTQEEAIAVSDHYPIELELKQTTSGSSGLLVGCISIAIASLITLLQIM